MSASIVTVLTPNGRRQNVKVQPNKTILQILEEVCSKHNFQSSDYNLKHHKRILDLSQQYRFSGLPNNAQIEMVERTGGQRTDQDVVLILQLEDGTRITGTFQPIATLAEILIKLCPDKIGASNLVVIYMRTEVYGEALESTTLRSIGLTGGRAILRLLQKDPDSLRIQANVSAPLPVRQTISNVKLPESESRTASDTIEEPKATANETIKETLTESHVAAESMEVVQAPTDEEQEGEAHSLPLSPENRKKLKGELSDEAENSMEISDEDIKACLLGDRDAVLFSQENATQIAVSDVDDSFFELNVEDVRILWRDLKAHAEELIDAPLLTSELRQIEEHNQTMIKLSKYKRAVLRIQFPNRRVLQASFSPIETIDAVINFIRQFLRDDSLDFYLYSTPPKNILPKELTLVELHCVPTAILHFGCDTNPLAGEFLKEDILEKCTTPNIALQAAARSRGLMHSIGNRSNNRTTQQGAGRASSSSVQSGNQVPKWFKNIGK